MMSQLIHKLEAAVEETENNQIPDITLEQSQREVEYKMSVKLLQILARRGIIDDVEYAQIDKLNRDSFSPTLSKVYV